MATRARVRSGCVAAKSVTIDPPSEIPSRTARSEPTSSITARTSSMRSSSGAMPLTRSDSPVPRLSKRISRPSEASRR